MGEPRHLYRLRVLEGAWGIGVDLTAYLAEPLRQPYVLGRFVVDTSAVDPPVTAAVAEELELGVRIVCRALDRSPRGGIIKVSSLVIWFPDFQDGGITLAMVGWLSEELGVDPPPISVRKDRERNCYVYDPPLETLG